MKAKIIKILISCLLMTTFLISGVACGGGGGNEAISSEAGYTYSKTNRLSFEGTHVRNIEESSTDLVKDGKSQYVLVLPQDLHKELNTIKDDFIILFRKATGITLPVKRDVQVVNDWDEDKKYISVGETSLVEKANIDKSEYAVSNIKNEGVRIITKGNTQFLLGGDVYGVVNAMYEFLTIYFNFDAYGRSSISLDTNVTNIKFKNIDLIEIPDVGYYSGAAGKYRYNLNPEPWDKYSLGVETCEQEVAVSDHRMRMHYSQSPYLQLYKNFGDTGTINGFHNLMFILPKDVAQHEIPDYIWKYKDDIGFYNQSPTIDRHEYMYPTGGGEQLCFTAHGDQDIYEDMIDVAAAKIIYSLILHSNTRLYRYATITVMDNWEFCSCEQCEEDMAKYASSGIVIRFINKVGEIVGKWLELQKDVNAEYHEAYREDFKILMFAYHRDAEPPVDATTNPDGSITYTPKDPSVVFNDMTAVWLVNTSHTSLVGVYDTLQDNDLEYYFPGWEAVQGSVGNSAYWYNSPVVGARDYAYDELSQYNNEFWERLAYYDYDIVFMDHFSGAFEQSGWHDLFNYVCTKLRWNCQLDINEIIRKYMEGMFFDAADDMLAIYEDARLYYVNIRANSADPHKHPNITKAEYYPYPTLEQWINKYEIAKEKIAHYEQTNPDLYVAVKTRIEIEQAGEVCKVLYFYNANESTRPFSLEKLNEYRDFLTDLNTRCPRFTWQGVSLSGFVGG